MLRSQQNISSLMDFFLAFKYQELNELHPQQYECSKIAYQIKIYLYLRKCYRYVQFRVHLRRIPQVYVSLRAKTGKNASDLMYGLRYQQGHLLLQRHTVTYQIKLHMSEKVLQVYAVWRHIEKNTIGICQFSPRTDRNASDSVYRLTHQKGTFGTSIDTPNLMQNYG